MGEIPFRRVRGWATESPDCAPDVPDQSTHAPHGPGFRGEDSDEGVAELQDAARVAGEGDRKGGVRTVLNRLRFASACLDSRL